MAKVVFLQNIKGVALIGDVKKVANGYARNFLFPRNLAKLATAGVLRDAEKLRAKREFVLAQEKENNKAMAERLSTYALEVERLANDEGTLYDGLDAPEVSHFLKKAGFDIEPEAVALEHPIKTAGEFSVTVNLDKETSAAFKINVKREENLDKVEAEEEVK